MKWFQNLSFRLKLILPLAVIAGVFVVLAWVSVTQINRLGVAVDSVVRTDMPAINDLLQADRDLYQALVAERTMIFVDVGSPDYATFTEQHAENVKQAHDRVERAASLLSAGSVGQRKDFLDKLEQFRGLRERWEILTGQVIKERSLDTRAGRAAAIDLTLKDAGRQFDAMRDLLDQLEEIVIAVSDEASRRAEAAVADTGLQLFTLVGVGIGLLVLVILALPPMIVGPLQRIVHRVRDIADGEGDLTARIAVDARDEIGALAATFNRLLGKLQDLVSQSVSAARQVDGAAARLATVVTETDQATSEQLSQIQMVAAAMHEMAATVNEVAVNTSHAAESARSAEVGVRSGAKIVQEASTAISQLADLVTNAGRAVAALEAETSRIGAVLEVIKGVAEQTSLLALNAAIEAARAGESGRGFAVVAAEVRNLASRTQKSTGEIEGMIASLQSSSRNVVGVMQSGRDMVDASLRKAAEAAAALEGITRSVTSINDLNTQIASATEEQSAVTEEMSANTVRIQDLAEHAASASRQTASARDDLVAYAQALNTGLARFKV